MPLNSSVFNSSSRPLPSSGNGDHPVPRRRSVPYLGAVCHVRCSSPVISTAGTPPPTRLTSEGNGYWYGEVNGVHIRDQYKLVILNDGQPPLWRKNPYASEVSNSSGNAIIHNPDFDWTGDDFQMPAWNELVIYELHVGTFNDPFHDGPGTFDVHRPKAALPVRSGDQRHPDHAGG